MGLSAPHDGAQLKNSHPPLPFIFLFFLLFYWTTGAQGRESLFTGAGRRDDDTSTVVSTAVTSPEAEEHDVKTTSRFPATGSKPTGPPAPFRPTLLCLGHEVPNNKKTKGGVSRLKHNDASH